MSEETGVSGDLDSLECLNRLECLEIWTVKVSVFRILQSEKVIRGWVVGGAFGK